MDTPSMKFANFSSKMYMGHLRATGPLMCTYMSVSPKTKKFSNKEEPIKMLLSHFRLIVFVVIDEFIKKNSKTHMVYKWTLANFPTEILDIPEQLGL